MKKILSLVLCIACVLCMSSCGTVQNTTTPKQDETTLPLQNDTTVKPTSAGHILVACFSQTGNTKQLSQYAADFYGADFFEIEAKVAYTEADLQYSNPNSRTSKEQNNPDARPEIANVVDDMAQYDTILLAYPIWWGQAPRIIDTFLESYDFSGKTIIPFCTSASSDIGSSDDNLHQRVSDSVTWIDGKRFAPGTDSETLTQWLSDLLD